MPHLSEIVSGACREFPAVTYALLFGSVARGEDHARSDVDLAIGGEVARVDLLTLEHRIEGAIGRPLQVVGVAYVPVALRYRIFRDGVILFERDHPARVRDQSRTMVEYGDYRFVESTCARGVLNRLGIGDHLGDLPDGARAIAEALRDDGGE